MRGQYRVWVPIVNVPTTEGSIAGLIVPANTIIEINRIELIGGGSAANSVRWQLRKFTGNTPTLSNANTPKAVDEGNAIASALSVGDKGAAGTTAVWSATPLTPQGAIASGRFEAYGGRDALVGSLQETIARIGGTAASYYDLVAVATTAVDCSLRITFTE